MECFSLPLLLFHHTPTYKEQHYSFMLNNAVHIRKEGQHTMNLDEGSYQLESDRSLISVIEYRQHFTTSAIGTC